jgi:hypothetical protein
MIHSGKIFGLLLGLDLMATLGWAAYLAIDYIVSFIVLLDAQVGRVTAIGSLVVLAAAALVAAAIRRSAAKTAAARTHEQKISAYQFFVECWQDPGTPPHKLQTLDRLLALYGGAAVVRAHLALRALAREKSMRHPDTAAQIGKVLLELRKDLGVPAEGISASELQHLVLASQAPQA